RRDRRSRHLPAFDLACLRRSAGWPAQTSAAGLPLAGKRHLRSHAATAHGDAARARFCALLGTATRQDTAVGTASCLQAFEARNVMNLASAGVRRPIFRLSSMA